MINENMMFECEWCHADLGSNPKAYDEHVAECPEAPFVMPNKGESAIEYSKRKYKKALEELK